LSAGSDLLGRAVGLMAPGDPGRDRLLAEQASSLMWAGRIADAEAACRSLLGRDHDRSVEGTVRVCLGNVLLAGGQAHDAQGLATARLRRPCDRDRAERNTAWPSPARLAPPAERAAAPRSAGAQSWPTFRCDLALSRS
jgi:hypothetical protein